MSDQAACAHLSVKRFTVGDEGRVFKEEWRCKDCGLQFHILDFSNHVAKLEYMEPHATLRDQFAIAALTGGLMRQGPTPITVKECYRIADAMMEARKQ
jgi:hypothetical protein